jgi:hypothetical protein
VEIIIFLVVLGMELRASFMLGKHFTTELYSQTVSVEFLE